MVPRLFSLFFAADCWPGLAGPRLALDRDRLARTIGEVASALAAVGNEAASGVQEEMIPLLRKGRVPCLDLFTGHLRQAAEAGGSGLHALRIPFGKGQVMANAGIGAIHPDCARPEQAMKFLLFLTEPESQIAIARSGQDFPVLRECAAAACPRPALRRLHQEVEELAMESLPLCSPEQPFAFCFLFEQFFPEIASCLEARSSIDETLDRIQRDAELFQRRVERLGVQTPAASPQRNLFEIGA